MTGTDVVDLLGDVPEHFEENINDIVAFLQTVNPKTERVIAVIISADTTSERIEIQGLHAASPLIMGLVGTVLYDACVRSYVQNGCTEDDVLADLAGFGVPYIGGISGSSMEFEPCGDGVSPDMDDNTYYEYIQDDIDDVLSSGDDANETDESPPANE